MGQVLPCSTAESGGRTSSGRESPQRKRRCCSVRKDQPAPDMTVRPYVVLTLSTPRPYVVHTSSIRRPYIVHTSSTPRPHFVHTLSTLRPYDVTSNSYLKRHGQIGKGHVVIQHVVTGHVVIGHVRGQITVLPSTHPILTLQLLLVADLCICSAGIISTFLHVHPFGANLEYLWSYIQRLDSQVKTRRLKCPSSVQNR